jgi:P27 family predicted phage terminase small subunit
VVANLKNRARGWRGHRAPASQRHYGPARDARSYYTGTHMRGPKPTPTQLKILRGNPGRRPLNDQEPQPATADVAPPDWLHGDAAAEWARLAPMLKRLGLLTEIDGRALASYCQTWARWREAETKIEEFGMVIKGRGGYPIISPFVAVANRAMGQMKAFLIEFGMTPSARSRVHATSKQGVEDPFAEFDQGLQRWTPPVPKTTGPSD